MRQRQRCWPETVEESLERERPDKNASDAVEPVDKMVQDELEIRRQLEEEREMQAWDRAKLQKDIQDYELEREQQESEDAAHYESLQAQYAQDWDDWVLWSSMNPTTPTRERPVKKQKMILHLQVQGDATKAARFDMELQPDKPVMLGMTWTVVEEMVPVEQGGGGTRASGSQASTERISPVTPEGASESMSAQQGPGHIAESELTAFMLGEEGLSVFRAWASGGFSAEQIQRLYGSHVLEAFLANRLMLEAGDTSGA